MSEPDIDKYIADIRARRAAQHPEERPLRVIEGGKGNGPPLPDLLIDSENLPAAARALRDLFAKTGTFFFNGNAPVRIVQEAGWPPKAIELTSEAVIVWAHDVCQPKRKDGHGGWMDTTLPKSVAQIYLNGLEGEWQLPALPARHCSAPTDQFVP
jgi:hypothetical protein